MITKKIQSFLNVIHLLSDAQVRDQHCYLCLELDLEGFTCESKEVILLNREVMARLYP